MILGGRVGIDNQNSGFGVGVLLKQRGLRGFFFIVGYAEVLVGKLGGEAAAGGPLQKAQLQQVRLVDVHDGI